MNNSERTNQWNPDVARVSEELASRLRTRGIDVFEADTPDELSNLADAVEEFETAVEEQGGDLMVDEPARGATAPQPDNPHFLLPRRAADESVSGYLKRLRGAIAGVRKERPG
jgi:hypothetical protein